MNPISNPRPCSPCSEIQEIAEHRVSIRNLEAWQNKQNGTLNRLEDKLDALRGWIMGALLAGSLSLAAGIIQIITHGK